MNSVWLAGVALLGLPLTINGQGTRIMSPVWSPEGSQIAFVSNRAGDPEIYLMDSSGGPAENLTQDAGLDLGPAWSHDGRRIAFVQSRR